MTFAEYAEKAHRTATYGVDLTEINVGVISECGEVLELLKYHLRHGTLDTYKVKMEMGDVLWYTSELARHLQVPLADVMQVATRKFEDILLLNSTPLIVALNMIATAGHIAAALSTQLLSQEKQDGGRLLRPHFSLVEDLSTIAAWMMALAQMLGITMEEVMHSNLAKLSYRKINGKESAPLQYPPAAP